MSTEEFKQLLEHDRGSQQIQYLAENIVKSTEDIKMMFSLILANEPVFSQRASMVLHHCTNIMPSVSDGFQKELIQFLSVSAHPGIHRSILRALEERPIQDEWAGDYIDVAFSLLQDGEQPVAIKVYAMGGLLNNCRAYPELLEELKLHVEEQYPFQSAAFKSKAHRVLKSIKKIL